MCTSLTCNSSFFKSDLYLIENILNKELLTKDLLNHVNVEIFTIYFSW